ncbi:MAG: hypothetical protein KAS32_16535 [Candidatus Peribacteraceae bacterium]|nr:hypothetical protein [Candidatus Peribacteraceae bacterium]
MGDLTANFSAEEFACKCPNDCDMKDGGKMDRVFVQSLQVIRDVLKKPLTITSGLRCKEWNKQCGGKDDSAHLKGLAADIECNYSTDRYDLIPLLRGLFGRIGIDKKFFHVDQDDSKSQNVMWVY